MQVKIIRRENLRVLAKSVGGITPLADKLNKTRSQISHLIGKKPIKNIGDKIAAEAEVAFNKPFGWLDHTHHTSEEEAKLCYRGETEQIGFLCPQIPLISWEEIQRMPQISQDCKFQTQNMIPTTINLGPNAFALHVQDDSMESNGISFPQGSIIIIDPNARHKSGSFVIVRVSKDRGITFKQFIVQEHKSYLRPLNRRYPILEFTDNSIVLGVVKQMVINFNSLLPKVCNPQKI